MYIPVRIKFTMALIGATAWLSFCTWFSMDWIDDLSANIGLVAAFLIIFFIALLPGFMMMFLFLAYIIDRRPKIHKLEHDHPPVSLIISAFNEENNIAATLKSILAQEYKGEIQIIVSDDGSKDKTVAVIEALKIPNLLLIKKHHGSKAHCLNACLKEAKHELVVTLDADTYLRPDALYKIVQRILSDPPNTAAVAGSVYVKNTRDSFITRMQEWDYIQAITAIKRVQSLFQGTLVAQGAFSIFRKEYLLEIGGWPATVGEDIVVSWGMLSKEYRIGFCEDAIAFTSVPVTYRGFFKQRSRWARGLIEAFRRFPRILRTPRLTMFFIYWNVFFPVMDFVYMFVFLPGIILAFFGYFFIAGPMTLAILPLAILYNYEFFITEREVFEKEKLKMRRDVDGFILYVLIYQAMMVPATIYGYTAELLGFKKRWGSR